MSSPRSYAPNAVFERLWQKVPGYIRWTFAMTLLMGLVAHLYAFTNDLVNHDDIYHLFQCDYGALSGRWFLPVVLQWDGGFSMPWLIGVLSLLCLAVTVCFAVCLLRVRSRLGCLIVAAILAAFPSVTATFTYMFTADAYFFAAMLAAFAAYAVWRMPVMGLPLGAIALIFSMGIYQSYFSVATVLMVGALLFDALDAKESFAQLILKGVKMLGALVLSLLVYMAAAHFATRNVGLTDYMGISEMGHLSLSELPALIVKCYKEYAGIFWNNTNGFYFDFLNVLIPLAMLLAVVLFLTLVARRRVGVLRGVLALVLLVVYPLAGNLIHIMVAGGSVHQLMIYGAAFMLVLPVALVDVVSMQAAEMGGARQLVNAALSWVILGVMALTAYSYIVFDNKIYQKMDVSKQEITAYSNRLLSAVEQAPGYQVGMPLVLVGASKVDESLLTAPEMEDIWLVGALNVAQIRAQYSYGEFLQYYMAYPGDVCLVNSADEEKAAVASSFAQRSDVLAMPLYPADGSIQAIDGYMVVKLS